MPKINVYLPDDLAEAVRLSGVPVSAVCQRALEDAVRRVTAIRSAVVGELTDEGLADRLPHFTARARTVVRLAGELARAEESTIIHSGHLLRGILDEGKNMALLVLSSMDIEADRLSQDLAGQTVAEEAGDSSDARQVSAAAANALELSVTEATSLGHNFVGCEHLLLGLASEPDGRAGLVLRGRGAEPKAIRRAILAALAGYAQGKLAPTSPGGASATAMADTVRTELRPLLERIERLEANAGL